MIYLDYHATTPCDPSVVQAMLPFFSRKFANPSSEIHSMGREARRAVETARGQIASFIGAETDDIVLTSGATESNNLAIMGLASRQDPARRTRIVTSAIEHKSVLAPLEVLSQQGFDVVVLPVDRLGRVSKDVAARETTDRTLLVSIQAANNEIGTIQDICAFSSLAHERGALFHCDAAQAAGKLPIDIDAWGVDLLSMSAHKMCGPKGIAALYVRGGVSRSVLRPLLYGGYQENGLRPGTLNVPLVVGFGEACRLAGEAMAEESIRLQQMRDSLEANLLQRIHGLKRNGALENRLPNNSSLTFPGIDAEALILNVPELALSTGSACNSGAQEPSYVLGAIGLSYDEANGTVRVGIGRFTTPEEIDIATAELITAFHRLGHQSG